MNSLHSPTSFILLFIILSAAATAGGLSPSPSSSPSFIGINYGQVANNLPSPDAVIPLLKSLNITRVKLYDTDPSVLSAFAGTDVEFTVGLPDSLVTRITDRSTALSWVRSNILPHVPATKITAVTVGNEVLTSKNSAAMQCLVPAMESLHQALTSVGINNIYVTTANSLAILSASFPPSAGAFRRNLMQYVTPLLAFHAKTGSPFLINAYPYFAYKADPKSVKLEYVLFEPNSGAVDTATSLTYNNMLHAQIDAVNSAVGAVAGGKTFDIVVSETGWPSNGDADEAGATAENSGKYNGNLMKMVMEGKGTPMRPSAGLRAYIFALFNENLKPGPTSERHYGLFKPDGTPAYQIGTANASAYKSSSGAGSSAGAESPTQEDFGSSSSSSSSSSSFMTISTAVVKKGCAFIPTAMAAILTGLIIKMG